MMMMMIILGGGVANKLLSECGASCAMQELIAKYIVLENYFMSESLSKVRHDNLIRRCYVYAYTGSTDGSLVTRKHYLFNG